MRNAFVLNIVLVLVCGVFGDEVKLSVMEGDSVILHTDLTDMTGVKRMMWRFGEEGSQSFLIENDGKVAYDVDKRFRDRLQVDDKTRDLTIKNMRTKHSGLYQAEINKGISEYKNIRVTVYDALRAIGAGTGDVESMSVMEGESVTLHTDVSHIQKNALIVWRFGDKGVLLAKYDKEDYKSSIYDNVEEIFKGRLKLDNKTGSLTITNTKATDGGVYLLKSSNSNQTLFKTFNVYVRDAADQN